MLTSEDKLLNHKLEKLVKFINSDLITFNDLKNIAYTINDSHKCESCYKEFKTYEDMKNLFDSFSNKLNKSLKECIVFLEKNGIINNEFINLYKNYKRRFVNGSFDYSHHNTLISLKKLENLLKKKLGKEYKSVFENIKYNYEDFYCCPNFKKPEKKIKLDLSNLTKSIPKSFIKNNSPVKDKEFVNDLISIDSNSKPLVWETKKTNYKKSAPKIHYKKTDNLINQEFEIQYNNYLFTDIQNLVFDYEYSLEKENIISEIDKLELISYHNPDNNIIENKLFKLHKLFNNKYYDSYLIDSKEINESISRILNKNIKIFNTELQNNNDYSNLYDINIIISKIKDLKYHIKYGYEIIDCYNLIKDFNNISLDIGSKINDLKYIEASLIKKYKKIIIQKNNIDDV